MGTRTAGLPSERKNRPTALQSRSGAHLRYSLDILRLFRLTVTAKPDIFLHIDDNRWALEKVKLEVKDPMLHISKCSRESGRCMCISPFFCCDLAPKVWCRCKGDTAGDWEYHRYIISFEFVTHWPLAACLTAWQERVVYRKLFLSMLRSLQKSHTFLMWVVEESEGQWFQSWKEQCFDTQMMQPIIHPASPLLGTFLQKYRWGAEYTRLMDVGMLPRRASGSHVSSCVESSSGQVTQQSLILVYILVMIFQADIVNYCKLL